MLKSCLNQLGSRSPFWPVLPSLYCPLACCPQTSGDRIGWLPTSLLQLALFPLWTGLAGCPRVCCNWPSTLCEQDWLVAHVSVATGPLPSVDMIGWLPTSLLQLALNSLWTGLAGCSLVCCNWPSTLCIQDWLVAH